MTRRASLSVALAAIAALLLAGCAAAAAPEQAPAAPGLPLAACRLSAPGQAAATTAAECGSLTVPEDRAAPGGRTIDLRVVVVPAINRDSAADPLLLLAGGPGQAASEAFTPLLPALAQVNLSRDLVLVDQRGTGASNPLSCPLEEADAAISDDPADPALQAWWRDCLAALDADPAQYTTEAAAYDLDAVRAALGYEQVSLLGVSYGTRAALAYLRLFPERVRALVLDGVVPPELPIGAAMGRDGQRAIDLTFAACQADSVCLEAFPGLPEAFTALLAGLEAEAPLVELADPFTGAPAEVRLTRDLAAATIHGLSYAPETAALIPLLIHTSRQGDLRPLAAQSLITARQLADSVDLGMRASVICAEDAPRFPATAAEGYLGDLMLRSLGSACEVWPRGAVSAGLGAPVTADVPALLLSGERDPVTPPAYGEAVAAGLPNSLHLVAAGQGHNIFFRGCLPTLVAEFLAAGSAAGLDTSCVERLGPTPFFTSFTGPRP
jgi:pimeloyl-ACP methyl ester carboxylesterase